MFGRNNNPFIKNPYVNVQHIIQQGDSIFFNLETTISNPVLPNHYKVKKVFNYHFDFVKKALLINKNIKKDW